MAPPSRQMLCRLLAEAMAKSISSHDLGQHGNSERVPTIDWMLLLISFIDEIILPHFWREHRTSTLQLGTSVRIELIATMLSDKLYRDHLRETLFLHAAKDPMTMANALRPGNTPQSLWKYFGPCMAELALHPSLWKLDRRVQKPCRPHLRQSISEPQAGLPTPGNRTVRKRPPPPRQPTSGPGGAT